MNNEPVAWLVDTVITYSDDIANGLSAESGKPVMPLYTTPQIKELSNISDIKRTSDQSITISFTSCRSASAFQAILKKASEK